MDGRRELGFERWGDVIADVDQLLAGHRLQGRWSLGQILYHLATAICLTIGADRAAPTTADTVPSRVFDVRRRRFFGRGRFPEESEIPHALMVPPEGAVAEVEAGRLRDAIRNFEAFAGEFPAHPVLGPLSKAEWDRFHRIHCAHHLSFARAVSTSPALFSSETGGQPP